MQREAANLAENGAHDINTAKNATLTAISEAEADGFKVADNLTVTDGRRYDIATIQSRNRALAEHAENIRWHAEQLLQTDSLVGQRLQGKATELDGIRFGDTTIQAASWGGFKQDGADDDWEPPVIKTEPQPKEPTVIDASPDPMFPNCDNIDVWNNIGQTLAGTAGVAIGIAGMPFTLGGTFPMILSGGALVVNSLNEMRHCG
ncbi:hypothetical protein [Mycolicibacterium sp. HK-90]|uniref:hypothetical protein n=1 Tax=Mycolicibacterium sp. HK-90 TaxID=3056937 RepID=UPI00265A779B|nr:hypothetical protein [Mycolicibacterium sp. HK-90]WKG06015.1 hypothetical protein QU592_13450 [Mycolicibacterium sp. HK-90]